MCPIQPFRYAGGTLTLELHVQPGASRSGWAGFHGDGALRLKLTAPAVDGKANQACIRFLAAAAGVSQRAVSIVRGVNSRQKTIRIEAVSEERFNRMQQQWNL